MKIETFLLERWMTRHETHVKYDIAESGILPMTTADLLDLLPAAERAAALERLLALPLGYSEARGTEELRGLLAATYARGDADNILVTTGAIEANFLLFNELLNPGDHVIAPYPAYQQLYSVPRAIGMDILPDGFAIKSEHLDRTAALQKVEVKRGDFVIVRTGQMEAKLAAGSWDGYPGGDAPGFSFETLEWIQRTELAALASDTLGCEVRPNETEAGINQPWHWTTIPIMGMTMGEIFYVKDLA